MKMILVFRFLSFLGITFLVMGCNGDDPVAPSGAGTIRPLAVGNWWIGRWMEFSPDGSTYPVRFDTTIIASSISYYGNTWWYEQNSTTALTNFDNGLWAMTGNIETDSVQTYCTRIFPAIVGDTVRIGSVSVVDQQGKPVDTLIKLVTVEAIDHPITVPAGTFSCYEYSERLVPANADSVVMVHSPLTRIDYYAPGLGQVRSDIFEQNRYQGSRLTRRWELTEFHLNQ